MSKKQRQISVFYVVINAFCDRKVIIRTPMYFFGLKGRLNTDT